MSACFIIYILWAFSDRPNKELNSFRRVLIQNPTRDIQKKAIDKEKILLSGATETTLFFSTSEPGRFMSSDMDLKHQEIINFNIPKQLSDSIGKNFFTIVDSPWMYVLAYNIPGVISYSISTKELKILYKPGYSFSRCIPFSKNMYLLRQIYGKSRDQIFSLWNGKDNKFKIEKQLFPIFHDGGIITDGFLEFDKQNNIFSYVFLYKNQFFIFDSMLNVIKKGNTIDTCSHFQIESEHLGNSLFTNSSPTNIINGVSGICKGYLFINSRLRADNERRSDFENNSVIDVYKTTDGKYVGSFYIPRIKKENLKKLIFVNNLAIGYYSDGFVTAKVNMDNF